MPPTLFTLEAVADDTGGAGAAATAASPPAPAAPSYAPADPQILQRLDAQEAFQRELIQALNEPETAPEPEPSGVHPLIEERARQIAAEQYKAEYDRTIAPYIPVLDQMTQERGVALVTDHLRRLGTEGDPARGIEPMGAFDYERVAKIAQAFYVPGTDPQQALYAAARFALDWESSASQSKLDAERESLQRRVDTRQTGPPGAATETPVSRSGLMEQYPEARDEYQARAMDWQARRGQGGPSQVG